MTTPPDRTEIVKRAIRELPDARIEELLKWLQCYYDEEVWDREIGEHLNRLGPERFGEMLNMDTGEDKERGLELFTLRVMLRHLQPTHRALAIGCLRRLLGGDPFTASRFRALPDSEPPEHPVDAA